MRMKEQRIPRQLLVCKPDRGKHGVGGQKRRWNDVVTLDLKKCELEMSWRELTEDRLTWRSTIKEKVAELNTKAEEIEQQRKDERRQRREGNSVSWPGFQCVNCSFTAQNKAGLVNHQRQKHSAAAQVTVPCQYCGRSFKRQGLKMHEKRCASLSVS